MNKTIQSVAAVVMVVLVMFSLTACGFQEKRVFAEDLTAKVVERTVETKLTDDVFRKVYNEFATKMLKALYQGDNACISPLSIAAAFGMVTNGANGQTKDELETLFGVDIATLNVYFADVMSKNVDSRELHIANSLWGRSGSVTMEQSFLDIVKNNYHAQVYSANFDNQTVDDINNWVYNNTRGGIDKLLDEIQPSSELFVLNALDFEAEWQKPFEKNRISDRQFFGTQGQSTVKMMYASEKLFIDTGKATGFIKPYKGNRYKFAAILPNQEVDFAEFVKSLDGDTITAMLSDVKEDSVDIGLPKFDFQNEFDLVPTLKQLGVSRAFESDADFSALGRSTRGNLYIGGAIHKTHISVDELKTKASAVTGLDMKAESVPLTVILDRPFVYMLLDDNDLPIFIGAVTNFK